ncbi:hypothetical protein CLV71_104200 [Actinophytocola oryzae]|uniref:Uncharacterized protein n=1 Tax=Actinophytocola oryzae TaxID=502181 RepID=A0A4R7VV57_9PSEU|nr:hypothetical protein CLV71_104200 [Actinophytocola oryzae]
MKDAFSALGPCGEGRARVLKDAFLTLSVTKDAFSALGWGGPVY